MANPDQKLADLRFFEPRLWGQAKRFREFYPATFKFDKITRRAIVGVEAHFSKATTFHRMAVETRPRLQIDRDELEAMGFSPAQNSRDLATLIEAAILEAYSSLDCTAKVLFAVYGKRCRGYRSGTRFLFMQTDEIEGPLPDLIRDELKAATWVEPLRFMRDELTHLTTGGCSLDHETGLVRYHHEGLTVVDKPLDIPDIYAWLDEMLAKLNHFLGMVFFAVNGELSDTPMMQWCGMTQGRFLARMVGYSHDISTDSGVCASFHWFDLPGNPTCPMAGDCGAYVRAKQMLADGEELTNPFA